MHHSIMTFHGPFVKRFGGLASLHIVCQVSFQSCFKGKITNHKASSNFTFLQEVQWFVMVYCCFFSTCTVGATRHQKIQQKHFCASWSHGTLDRCRKQDSNTLNRVTVTLCSMDRGIGCSGLLVSFSLSASTVAAWTCPNLCQIPSDEHGCLKQGITRGLKIRCVDTVVSDEWRWKLARPQSSTRPTDPGGRHQISVIILWFLLEIYATLVL